MQMQIDKKFIEAQIIPTRTGFVIDINKLKTQQVSVLRAIYKAADKHLKYYHSTMKAFANPDSRPKSFDTQYYEQVMPEVAKILREYEQVQQQLKNQQ